MSLCPIQNVPSFGKLPYLFRSARLLGGAVVEVCYRQAHIIKSFAFHSNECVLPSLDRQCASNP